MLEGFKKHIYIHKLYNITQTHKKMPNKQTTNQPLVTSQIVSRRFNHRLKAEPAKGWVQSWPTLQPDNISLKNLSLDPHYLHYIFKSIHLDFFLFKFALEISKHLVGIFYFWKIFFQTNWILFKVVPNLTPWHSVLYFLK